MLGPRHIQEIVVPQPRSPSNALGGLRTRARYRFDNLLARGTWAVLLWLGVVTIAAVLVTSGLLAAFGVDFAGTEETSWLEDFWQSLLRVIDPGTMAGDIGWGQRVLALLITMFGILVAGTLIGFIASGVEQRVEELRRGRSTVLESGHVLILGASSRLPVVIEQLALAGIGRRGANVVVVLADREPVQMSEDVRAAVGDLQGTRLVFRRGDPARLADLQMVALHHARAVIVLAEDDVHGDGRVVRVALAVRAELGGADDGPPIVAELRDAAAAEGLRQACGDAVHTVVAARSLARITTFALREPGLNQVVTELLDFRGCDIHVCPADALVGEPFGACVLRFTDARPIGRIRADGDIDLHPDPQTVLQRGDRLIVIADHECPVPVPMAFANTPPRDARRRARAFARRQEHLLIVGWNALGTHLLSSLDEFAAPGSVVSVVIDQRVIDPQEVQIPPCDVLDVRLQPSNGAPWQVARDALTPDLTAVVLLAYRHDVAPDEADSRTLLTHMLLQRELDGRRDAAPGVIVELVNADNVDLARITGGDDYLVSDAITSRILTQLAEQPERRPILLRLYAPDGPSIRLVSAGDLGLTGELGCDEIIATAYAAGFLALGWRRGRDVVLNPESSRRVTLDEGDQIVAIG